MTEAERAIRLMLMRRLVNALMSMPFANHWFLTNEYEEYDRPDPFRFGKPWFLR